MNNKRGSTTGTPFLLFFGMTAILHGTAAATARAAALAVFLIDNTASDNSDDNSRNHRGNDDRRPHKSYLLFFDFDIFIFADEHINEKYHNQRSKDGANNTARTDGPCAELIDH